MVVSTSCLKGDSVNKLLLLLPLLMLIGCTPKGESFPSEVPETIDEKTEEVSMVLKIDNNQLDITWENNDSVKALNELAKPELIVTAHQYGDFEQVGSLGHTIVSNDINIKTVPGDVVLYSSNQIVIFFGSNTWSYTKLGHINLSKTELENILKKDNVTITLIGG